MTIKSLSSWLCLMIFLLLVFPFFCGLRANEEWIRQQQEMENLKLRTLIQQTQEGLIHQELQIMELMRQKAELKSKLKELMRSVIQEKTIAELMLKKQREDETKIKKIEKLWEEARRLYDRQRYEESIKLFEEIIDLEAGQ